MKYRFMIICLLLFNAKSIGQDSIPREKYKIQLFDSYKNEYQVKNYLNVKKGILKIMFHPLICRPEVLDTLKFMSDNKVNSTNLKKFLESDSTWIYLKESYRWNIENKLPQKPKLSNLKFIFKRECNYTENDKKLLHYLNFYSAPADSLVERFIYYQNFSIPENRLIQVVYEIKLKDTFEIELQRINEVKK